MIYHRLLLAVCLAVSAIAMPSAQSDLDALMSRVLERRDENWKKLQQYTLNELETLQLAAVAVFRLYGFEREYLWFPRKGFFIRSPLKADGVTISDDKRRDAEDRWLRRSQNRERHRAERANKKTGPDPSEELAQAPGDVVLPGGVEDVVRQSFEPQFIESANFLRFKFDQGQYALAGRERVLDRDVLKIEYYPKLLFREDRTRQTKKPAAQREQDEDETFENQMNKVSLVTLWVDPAEHQILRYEFRNIEMDFLPARWLVRIDGLRATMQMSEPFPGVWLPASISMRFRMRLAAGPFDGRYDVKYSNYRLPEVSGRVVE
jgi:hypothetical protein